VKVLFFNWRDLAHPQAGGAEVWTERVARHLVMKGHRVTLFVAAVAGRPEREVVEGVTIVRRGSKFGVYREAKRFWRETGHEFDVVMDEINTRPFLAPAFAGNTPVLAIAHQVARDVWFEETSFPVAMVGRYVLEPKWLRHYRATTTLTLSDSSAESLAAYGLEDVHVLTPGGDPVVRPAVQKEAKPTIAFLGRLVPSKRPDHAIDALRHVRLAIPDAQLWLMGDGPMLPRLAKSAGEGVHFLGRVPHAERNARLARAHVLVATSVREGWGLNVSEAAVCGTPSIGYAVPGLVDSIPRSGGALVPPDPEALASSLVDFFERRLELCPRESTQSWDAVGDAVERHLEKIIAAHD
jgi:glycosyltransferase involved in cell wall biosynthesis